MNLPELTPDHPALQLPNNKRDLRKSILALVDTFRREEYLFLMRDIPGLTKLDAEIILTLANVQKKTKDLYADYKYLAHALASTEERAYFRIRALENRRQETGIDILQRQFLSLDSAGHAHPLTILALDQAGLEKAAPAMAAYAKTCEEVAIIVGMDALNTSYMPQRMDEYSVEDYQKIYSSLLSYLRGDPLQSPVANMRKYSPQEKIALSFFHAHYLRGETVVFKEWLDISLFPPHMERPANVRNSVRAVLNKLNAKQVVGFAGSKANDAYLMVIDEAVRAAFGFVTLSQPTHPSEHPAGPRPLAGHRPG